MANFSFHHLYLPTSIAISCLVFISFHNFRSEHATSYRSSDLLRHLQMRLPDSHFTTPTNVTHIGFIVVSSLKTWNVRKPYVLSWWRPNVTRGYLFLDKEPTSEFLPWPTSYPPFRVNDDITKLRVYPQMVNPVQFRIMRSILDMYRVKDRDLRWFIMCDDDTLVFVDNLVDVLGKYDHTKYHYIGAQSEFVHSNAYFSFDMAFGGGGYALSYALVEVLAPKIDACIDRYPHLLVSDHLAQSCLADIGVSLTIEKGIHQIDLRGDISGFLSSHPQAPLLTLHHLNKVDPIFPSMDRFEAASHLMEPGKVDQSRLVQQTICYQRENNFSFSVSWGYSVHIYESIIPRSILRKPLETFSPWASDDVHYPYFMFNTRRVTDNPCKDPHVFFFRSIEPSNHSQNGKEDVITTSYVRSPSIRELPPCSASGSHSADAISMIRVMSSATVHQMAGVIECCDVEYMADADIVDIKIRSCMRDEVIA
ncbi:hypothetical protein LINPERHAP1_LOCUS4203 [Linum perenne]